MTRVPRRSGGEGPAPARAHACAPAPMRGPCAQADRRRRLQPSRLGLRDSDGAWRPERVESPRPAGEAQVLWGAVALLHSRRPAVYLQAVKLLGDFLRAAGPGDPVVRAALLLSCPTVRHEGGARRPPSRPLALCGEGRPRFDGA